MIPSAAPYSVIWNAERQVTTESPLNAGFLLSGVWLGWLPLKKRPAGRFFRFCLLLGVSTVPVVADRFVHGFAQPVDTANRTMSLQAEPWIE